jgi:hypothetical protein
MAHANLGIGLLHLGQHGAALAACRQAMRLDPQGAAIASTLGGTMLELGEAEDAIALCRRALALEPASAVAHFNLSHGHKALNQLEAAEEAAAAAIALQPGSAVYRFHLAHILLLQGQFARGWDAYEARWDLPDFADTNAMRRGFAQPQWAGEDLGGKTILIYTEQGLGDIIQFARYIPLLVAKGARVILAAQPPTRRLLATIPGPTLISFAEIAHRSFDLHCPLLSLPRAFATRLDSIPAGVPYVYPDAAEVARWSARLATGQLRVGIVWAGNPATMRDWLRSPGLLSLVPLFDIPGITFVVLQLGPGRADCAARPLPAHVLDPCGAITDLADTAAIMAGLDLMISSCTAPLHLAGALGVPSWAMIPFAPHFPWLLDRTDTPWYPSMRLYRQGRPGRDWSDVVQRMSADLRRLAASADRTGTREAPRSTPSALRQAATDSSVIAG